MRTLRPKGEVTVERRIIAMRKLPLPVESA